MYITVYYIAATKLSRTKEKSDSAIAKLVYKTVVIVSISFWHVVFHYLHTANSTHYQFTDTYFARESCENNFGWHSIIDISADFLR